MSYIKLTEDEFFEQYKPIKNHLDRHASFDGCLFETYGAELEFVRTQDPLKVWTVLDCDGLLHIGNGYHQVNRLGYLITDTPYEGQEEIDVILE